MLSDRLSATAAIFSVLILVSVMVRAAAALESGVAPRLSPGQIHYTEGCGGCHGLLGRSSRKDVPQIEGEVGYYLCTQEGREYIVQLPNVAFANMNDVELAQAMNFTVFSLGGASVPAGAKTFTPDEVGRLRQFPLKSRDLVRMRAEILGRAITACNEMAETQAFEGEF